MIRRRIIARVLREIRRLPEEEVVRRWIDLYVSGKHAGRSLPDPARYLGQDDVWVEVEIPHDLYDADWNTEGADLSPAQLERATRYSITPGKLPPGMASYRGRRLRGKGLCTVFDFRPSIVDEFSCKRHRRRT